MTTIAKFLYNVLMPGRSISRKSVGLKLGAEKAKLPRTITIPPMIMTYILIAVIFVGVFILGFVLGVLITKVHYLEKGATSTTGATTDPTATSPDITDPVDVGLGHLPVQGDKNAKVSVVEFADFQCPFCEQWFKEVGPNIIKDYVDTGKAKFAFRHYAFLGQESTDSANASECANEQGKFWEYHDYLYSHQGPENSGTFAPDKLKGFAADLGLNTDQFNSCLDSNKFASNVTKDQTEGQTAGVQGTPATFINGMLFSGACPYTNFKQAMDFAIAGTPFKISGADGCTVTAQ